MLLTGHVSLTPITSVCTNNALPSRLDEASRLLLGAITDAAEWGQDDEGLAPAHRLHDEMMMIMPLVPCSNFAQHAHFVKSYVTLIPPKKASQRRGRVSVRLHNNIVSMI